MISHKQLTTMNSSCVNLSPNKRWEVLFEQAAKLNQINPKKYLFHLVTPQKNFRNMVKTKYPDLPIRYHQNLTQKEMMRLYKIDIFGVHQ